ncbi:hypothetical protein NADFUDRAFT_46930 [Nadsonia fulvescens var. elongata DSM 6958]|uniref:Uncharacterized protein n=1 Tax=Nadsonia fulvescens var. elongata DSM 6958 TaxID=857566 RepID=A0A1E3PK29_9ASCO|nr:hypothetical protein NADFUDRAFT_46930 [Nadsonia fulvescens var. elongata DSM 6958]
MATGSRQELIAWVNELLVLDITKIEQLGTGAVFCQIFDSIFLDVPMSRVKFNVSSEYQYIQNFKILQSIFTKNRIDRQIPVERLVKCRFQDNLDFLQFSKKYWEVNNSGQHYDALSRRGGGGPVNNSIPARSRSNNSPSVNGVRSTITASGPSSTTASTSSLSTAKPVSSVSQSTVANRPGQGNNNPIQSRKTQQSPSVGANARISRSSPAPGAIGRRQVSNPLANTNNTNSINNHNVEALANASANAALVINLQRELTESESLVAALRNNEQQTIKTVNALENERDFYFHKLRDIEMILQELTDGMHALANTPPKPEKPQNPDSINGHENMNTDTLMADQDDVINEAAAAEAAAMVHGINLTNVNQEFDALVGTIQQILYATEEGFEIPEDGEVMAGMNDEDVF